MPATNTIDTIDDLIALLDRNPQWLDALRSRLLTPDLLELPARFSELVEQQAAMAKQLAALAKQQAELAEQLAELAEQLAELAEQLAALAKQQEALAKQHSELVEQFIAFREEVRRFIAATERRFAENDRRFDRLEAKTDRLEKKTDRMMDDLGVLKGAHARNAAVEEASTIARDLGLRRTKTLTRDDLWDLTDRADTAAIDRADLRSFRRADLIMEATDEAGASCYVAVEISFTANGRDTTRALRNAEFLTRFTGRRAYAVVSGLRRDDRISDSIDAGAVFWHQLDPEIMEVE